VASVRQVVRTRAAAILAVIGSAVLIGMATLFPTPGVQSEPGFCILCGRFGGTDFLLNVVLFVPFGFALHRSGLTRLRAIAVAFAFTLLIELLQLSIIEGRDAALGDILANTLGGVVGAALAFSHPSWLVPTATGARRLFLGAAAFWLAVLAGTAWAVQPQLPAGVYWAQIGPELGNLPTFVGEIHAVRLGGAPLVGGPIAASDSLRAALRDQGVSLDVEVTSRAKDMRMAPVAVLVNDARREVAMLALAGPLALFRVRTRTAVIGMHSPGVALIGALGSGFENRARITASQRGTRVHLRSETPEGAVRSGTISFGPELGWLLILPADIWLMIGEPFFGAVSAVWLALLAAPMGYWLALAGERWSATRAFTGALVAIAAGLVFVPLIFAMRASPLGLWIGSVLGVALGTLMARLAAFRRDAVARARRNATAHHS
jgi:hypothetical protein